VEVCLDGSVPIRALPSGQALAGRAESRPTWDCVFGQPVSEREEVVESLSRDIIEKVLHVPVAKLLSATARNQLPEIVQTVRRIFNVHS
jgi:glutamyl-tRNA reductase